MTAALVLNARESMRQIYDRFFVRYLRWVVIGRLYLRAVGLRQLGDEFRLDPKDNFVSCCSKLVMGLLQEFGNGARA